MFVCVWGAGQGGNNLIAELNLYLVHHWHLQQAEKPSYPLQTESQSSVRSRSDTFALLISSESKLFK